MSNLEQYTNLHKYAQRLAEDDLTDDQGPQATVACVVGRVVQSVGNTIEEAAIRIHNATPEQAERFYAAVGSVATQTQLLAAIVSEVVQPLGDLVDDMQPKDEDKLSDAAYLFDDGFHQNVLNEAQQFLSAKEAAQ